jgi:muconate cycloisomerase
VTGETLESVKTNIATKFSSQFVGQRFTSWMSVVQFLRDAGKQLGKQQLASFCALELALLDLAGRRFQYSAGDVLGSIKQNTVYYSGVIAAEDPASVTKMSTVMKQFGVRQVKVKLVADLETNQQILTVARSILGDQVELRGDANAAWDADTAIEQLGALKQFQLAGIEQPVPAQNLEDMIKVTAAGLAPVVADESLCSLEDARILIAENGCDVFNLRISKCGGLLLSQTLWQMAQENQLECQLGAQVGETGLLSAAGRQFATRIGDLRWLEGSYGKFLMSEELAQPDLTIGAQGAGGCLEGPGLGVEVDTDKLNQLQTYSQSFSAKES